MSIQFSVTTSHLPTFPRRQVSATNLSSHQPPATSHHTAAGQLQTSCVIRTKISPFTLKIHCKCKCTADVLQTSSVHLPTSTACRDILNFTVGSILSLFIVLILLVFVKLLNVCSTPTVCCMLLMLQLLTHFTCVCTFTMDRLPPNDIPTHCLFPLFLCCGVNTAPSYGRNWPPGNGPQVACVCD